VAGGPHTREHYKVYTHPMKFDGRLPARWASGDDRIYEIPWRADPLVRIVRQSDIVSTPPVNGIDTAALRKLAAAFDDPTLPVVHATWESPSRVRVQAPLSRDQVVSTAINWHSGWTARVNGREAPVSKDALGFLTLAPACSGACDITLAWKPGSELAFCALLSFAALCTIGFAAARTHSHHRRRSVRVGGGA
jgi:hypothetical protein